ncbi:pyridine nucleotide-disulfide oxidoreductase [Niveispirillum lacus]|uniref:Pyridine nucleotide-disulfide oxidoreductase n=1 Tax=Niveispirillum lacus TaxID=1981099 RepID=A0A255Z3P6_9PROT|nr:FAD-dependent oxidoreductase [Niveispirillum lacus]OYQ36143.1 pyridine nucleotide-disulfide oxidoreductase [Niveispirillum lacus]
MAQADHYDIVIAGAGQAAAQCAQSLRQGGFAGSLALIGDENHAPYERPPLSKDYLSGKRDAAKLLLRKPDYWLEKQVTLLTGQRIGAVDRGARVLTLTQGRRVTYGKLVWATGGRPRRLSCPGADLAGVHAIRSIADIDGLKADLAPAARVVIIGGGYIGLETAAVLRGLGHPVTVLEAQDRLLARVTSPPVSAYFADLHRRHGVDVRLSAQVAALHGGARVESVELSDGVQVPADIVVVGIGIIPNVEPLAAAGLPCPNGVVVDAHCRTEDPDILAIGDCALHPNLFAGRAIRLESVPNAVDQGKVAADTLLGQGKPYSALPWFWSDQYDVKMQAAGLAMDYDRIVPRGDPSGPGFAVLYLRAGRIIAIDCLNAPRDFIQAKALITGGTAIDADRAADPGVELKTLAAAQ